MSASCAALALAYERARQERPPLSTHQDRFGNEPVAPKNLPRTRQEAPERTASHGSEQLRSAP
eukprot:10534675-Alexandrium_andersonii.AAC.1